jgi:hypothetical protein
MKYPKLIIFNLTVGLAFLLNSCDSSNPLGSQTNNDIAKSLEITKIGDTLIFNPASGPSDITQFEFSAGGISSFGDGSASYIYKKAGVYSYTIELDVSVASDDRFQRIVNNLLGRNSSLATEFRALIVNRSEPNFTDAEVERLKAILNPSGADLSGNSVNELSVTSARNYTCYVTSTERSKILGTMGGVYTLQSSILAVGFRYPTAAELDLFRFLSPTSQIPFTSTEASPAGEIENGTWVMTFSN